MASFFNLKRDGIWLLVLPALLIWVVGSQLNWFGQDREEPDPLQGPALQYVGLWTGQSEQLEISANGYGNYFTLNEKWRGARVTISDSAIVLHGGPRRQSFLINKPPFAKNNKTFIKLDGREFERGGQLDPKLQKALQR